MYFFLKIHEAGEVKHTGCSIQLEILLNIGSTAVCSAFTIGATSTYIDGFQLN